MMQPVNQQSVSPSLSRRQVGRLLVGSTLTLVAGGALATHPAAASPRWCRTDPAFLVGDQVVDVVLGSDPAMLLAASDPIQLELHVPVGVPASLLAADAGFGHGYAITIKESKSLRVTALGMQLRVTAKAPATNGQLPVTVYFTSLDTAGTLTRKESEGTANSWITVVG